MPEVISDLRNEEQATGALGYVFPEPAAVPVTKVKRKPKATNKREPMQYTLAIRSHDERERLIAMRASAVLHQDPDDPLKPSKLSFSHSQPVSEYLRQYLQDEKPMWQRASLKNQTIDQSDVFYVSAFRSVINPQEKKSGYTNIMFHVSQLPGRNSTQVKLT